MAFRIGTLVVLVCNFERRTPETIMMYSDLLSWYTCTEVPGRKSCDSLVLLVVLVVLQRGLGSTHGTRREGPTNYPCIMFLSLQEEA